MHTTAGIVHRLCRATGDMNVSRFFVYFQMKLNAMQRLRHHTGGTLANIRAEIRTKQIIFRQCTDY